MASESTATPPPADDPTAPTGIGPEWLRSVLATQPERATPEQTAQAQAAALIWLDAMRAKDPAGALLAAEAVTLHIAAMDTLRQAIAPQVTVPLACRLRSNAASMTRTTLRLVQRLQDAQAVAEGGVPDLATMRAMLPEAAPPASGPAAENILTDRPHEP